MIYAYAATQPKNQAIARAFAAGCGAEVVGPYPLKPEGDVFMFGCLRGLLPTLRAAQREGRRWLYADNGYFLPGRRLSDNGYYRVTRCAYQHDGSGQASMERWNRLGIAVKPWRRTGNHIVLCPPSRLHAVIHGFDADQWLTETVDALKQLTDRPIRLRKKMSYREVLAMGGPPLEADLRGAWALVTHSSNSAVKAVLAGVPVFCTDQCAASIMGLSDIGMIEAPATPDGREQWAWNLASAQWTADEMRDGTCWRALSDGR